MSSSSRRNSSRRKEQVIPQAHEVLANALSQVSPLASLPQALPQATQTAESRQQRQQRQQLPQKIVKFLDGNPRLDLLFPSLYTQTMNKLTLSFNPASMGQIAKNISYMNAVKDLIKKGVPIGRGVAYEPNFIVKLFETKNIKMTTNPEKLMVLRDYAIELDKLLKFLFMTPAGRRRKLEEYRQSERIRLQRLSAGGFRDMSSFHLAESTDPTLCKFFEEELFSFLKNNSINYNNPRSGFFKIDNEHEMYGIRCTLNRLMSTDEISKFFRPFHSETDTLTNSQFFMYFYTKKQVEVFEYLYRQYCDNCGIPSPSFLVTEYGSKSKNIVLILQ
jgi:hypothetical protein